LNKPKAIEWLGLFLLSALSSSLLPILAKGVDYDGQITSQLAIMEKYNHYANTTPDDDKTAAASDKITELLLKWAPQSELLRAPFKKARAKGFLIAESKDNNLRVYSWDTLSGGTAHSFGAVTQCRVTPTKIVGKDIQPSEAGDMGASYDQVVSQRTTGGDTIYTICGTTIGSTIDIGSVIYAFKIKRGKLIPAKVFKTKTGLLDTISCFCYGKSDQTRASIEFVDNNKTLKVPLNTETEFTGKYLLYKFDGQNYVYSGTGK
jgi:hypothetical protein